MIIGNGDVASVLPDRDDLIFFASGVSNSQETREESYRREKDLFFDILNDHYNEHIVYFSSLSVFYGSSRYTRHKREMEQMIKKSCISWTIIRIGNITWGKNPHTLINFFKQMFKDGKQFEIRDEYRYIIDKDEFLHWIDLIPSFPCEMNITGKRMKVVDIVKEYGHA